MLDAHWLPAHSACVQLLITTSRSYTPEADHRRYALECIDYSWALGSEQALTVFDCSSRCSRIHAMAPAPPSPVTIVS